MNYILETTASIFKMFVALAIAFPPIIIVYAWASGVGVCVLMNDTLRDSLLWFLPNKRDAKSEQGEQE